MAVLLAGAVAFAPVRARADDHGGAPLAKHPVAARVTAVIPGALVHGTGHLVAGRTKTGLRLLALEGAGVGLIGAGLAGIAATGASRRTVAPLAYVTLTGAALFFLTFAADLYGTFAPEEARGSPARQLAWVETQVGLRAIADPVFDYGLLATQAVDLREGALRLSPSAAFALDDTNRRLRLATAYRVTGPRPDRAARDGSYLEIEGAVTDHAYTSNGFARTTGEISVQGRLDMKRLAADLRGSFAEAGLGLGLASIRYRAGSTETDQLLLGRLGYGVYIGAHGRPRGEVLGFYDHRRDGYVAGMKVPGIGAGFLGSVGATGRYFFDEQWGVQLDAQAGSAIAGGASILFREGVLR